VRSFISLVVFVFCILCMCFGQLCFLLAFFVSAPPVLFLLSILGSLFFPCDTKMFAFVSCSL